MRPPHTRRSPRARLPVVAVYRDAARVYRTRFHRVVGTALVVLVPVTALQVTVIELGRDGTRTTTGGVLVVVAALTLTGLNSFSSTFYAGVLDRTVGAVRGSYPERTIRAVFRDLPYRRLIAADLLFWALVVVGSVALVIPGLVVLTVFSIVGPVLLIEDRPVLDAFRRSARLVRPHFWRVTLTVLVPTVVESALADELLALAKHPTLWHELLVECGFAAIVASFTTLLEVQTAYQLIDLEAAAPTGGASDASDG